MTLALSGGVTPAAVLVPSVGVYARLSLACYLGIPLTDVAMTSVANGSVAVVVAAGDPVNTQVQSAGCAALSASRALRPLPPIVTLTSASEEGGARHGRSLAATDGSLTTVMLVSRVEACAVSVTGSAVLSAPLSALIASLGSNASVGSNSTAGTVTVAPRLGSFLSAAAGAAGVPPAAVSASSSVGAPRPVAAAPAPTAASDGGGSAFPLVALVAAVAAVLLLALVVAAVVIFKRRRTQQPVEARASDAGEVAGENPMLLGAAEAGSARGRRAATDGPRHERRSVKTTFGQRQAAVPAPDGVMQDNPMRSGTRPEADSQQQQLQQQPQRGRAASSTPGRLYPKLGVALPPTQGGSSDSGGGGSTAGLTMTANPMMVGAEGERGATETAAAAGSVMSPVSPQSTSPQQTSGSQLQQSASTYANRKVIRVGGSASGGAGGGGGGPGPSTARRGPTDGGTAPPVREGPSSSFASSVSRNGSLA